MNRKGTCSHYYFCLAICVLMMLSGCAPLLIQSQPGPVELHCTESLKQGLNRLECRDGQSVLLYLPDYPLLKPENVTIVAVIHGYQADRSLEQGLASVTSKLECWYEFARDHNCILVGPLFDRARFHDDYQRLNLRGPRADLRLNRIVDELALLLPGINTSDFLLFGFSGGGQYVHRYAAFNPKRVRAAVAAGAGWYMWPEPELAYPVGFKMPRSFPGERPRIETLRQVPLLVLVGEDDVTSHDFRQLYQGINLDSLQGTTRLERAENWFNALHMYAESATFTVQFAIIPDTGHTISAGMLHQAGLFLEQYLE
ncbi:hypothetical protein JXQ70_07525 [bacterium]|nr:hypothetical protein [bacterium]